MRKDCDTCLHDEFGEKYCNDCYWASGKPPTKWEPAPFWTPDTNADLIRAMSDEELGKFLGECKFCDICDEGCDNCTYHGDCDKRLLDWLKQPAEVTDNG